MNYCAGKAVTPDEVDDTVVHQFHVWLEESTLYPRPKDMVRRTPCLWNEASERIGCWPKAELTIISFKAPQRRLRWVAFTESFRADAEQSGRQPNAFATGLAQTLLQVARHHLPLADDAFSQLKRIAAKLPPIPLELTPKNKASCVSSSQTR
ncbi:MAG: hypothetical protein ACR2J1_11730 [Methyloceanibacter sp.]|uniref:hypothetical protein n=1 Tax=Methyloceanibacter sp. TaxID=1965321 RepID=UPI003D9B3DA1